MFKTARLVLCVCFCLSSLNAASFHAAGDFSTTTNPNGPWSYGGTPTLGGTFTASTIAGPSPSCSNSNLTGWVTAGDQPYVLSPLGGQQDCAGSITVPTGVLDMHPTSDGIYSVVRFTSPYAGIFDVTGFFQALHYGDTDDHVLASGTPITNLYLQSNHQGSVAGFSLTVNLNAGDTLDFAVGMGSNGYAGDSTAFDATITDASQTPEPATWFLIASGLCAATVLRRRSARSV